MNLEVRGSEFQDTRLRRRFAILLEKLWNGMGQTIPFACQDWASTKGACRILSDDRVSEHDIRHFQASSERVKATGGPVLILQDTTTFSYQRERPELIGHTGKTTLRTGNYGVGPRQPLTQCGILMHSSLVVTADGLPLGLAAVKFWTRKQFKGAYELKRHINPTRVPIEEKKSWRWLENTRQSTGLLDDPVRCIHIGDRESGIYELLCIAYDLRTHFLVRTCFDRLAGDGQNTISKAMQHVQLKGPHRVELRDAKGRPMTATLELRYS
ncbi:IS4/Tn5 family transposase DNA-binding protein [Paraburkholderia humisilvae]|nr:transposase DNA-binding-containing protein [Paraburkholderia humisilvae]